MFRALLLLALFPALSLAQGDPGEWVFGQPFMPHQGRLGAHVQSMTPELREYFGVPSDLGVLVTAAEPGKPAAKAGLRAGDVIIRAGERSVRSPTDLMMEAARVPPGADLTLRVVRNKAEETIVVRPEGEAMPWIDPEYWRERLGEGMREGSREMREQLENLQRRLDELERRFDEERREREHDMDRT